MGPPVSGTEGEREEVGAEDCQWAPEVRVLVFPSRETEYRVLVAANDGAGREGCSHGRRGWSKNHGTAAKHRRQPSPANRAKIERKQG
jgi:hypothetical protein